jgi:hypothetical protein
MNALTIAKALRHLPPDDLADLIGACFELLPPTYPLPKRNREIVRKWLNNCGV